MLHYFISSMKLLNFSLLDEIQASFDRNKIILEIYVMLQSRLNIIVAAQCIRYNETSKSA